MRRAVLPVLVVIALLPSVASAVTPGGHRNRPASPAARGAGHRWLSQQRKAMRRAGMAHIVRVGGAGSFNDLDEQAFLESVGDLRGNGRRNVLEIRQTSLGGGSSSLGMTARDGRTGNALWSRQLVESDGDLVAVFPEVLGVGGRLGLLAMDVSEQAGAGGNISTTLQLRAFAGASGKLQWVQRFTGIEAPDQSVSELPVFAGVLVNSGSRVADFLIAEETTMGPDDTTVAEVVSGTDGTFAKLGGSVTTSTDFPEFLAIPDVDGDGLGDALVMVPGPGGFLRAVSRKTGAPIWTSQDVPIQHDQVVNLGRFSSTTSPDLAVEADNTVTGGTDVYVVNGRTGKIVWKRAVAGVNVLHRAGKHLIPAVGLFNRAGSANGPTTTGAISYRAVTASNKVLYSKRVSVSVQDPAHTNSSTDGGEVFTFGDVQPDGSTETAIRLDASASSKTTTRTKRLNGIIDGRTGHFRKQSFQTTADGSLHKGRGTDLLSVSVFKGHPRIAAWRGSTGKRYYRRVVRRVGTASAVEVSGLRVTGHACSDLAFASGKSKHIVLGILTAAGVPLWTIGFPTTSTSGGTLTDFKKPKHFCV